MRPANDLIARQTRADMLHTSAAVARKMKVMLDGDIVDLFDRHERALIEAMIAADDDLARRDAAAHVTAWRALRALIRNTVAQESYAVKKLEEIAHAG